MGIPHHFQLLSSVSSPPKLPQVTSAVSAGELLRAPVAQAFAERYGFDLGAIYGMTETGLIAADLSGLHRPAVGLPAPGMQVQVQDGELWVHVPRNPYLGEVGEGRWVDGWLRTGDAASIEAERGLITLYGRTDSQVAVGGLKVDLSEVEHELAAIDGVLAAVVLYDRVIEAFVELAAGRTGEDVQRQLAERIAPFKRPRRFRVLSQLPRTSTGKLSRDVSALRSAAAEPATS